MKFKIIKIILLFIAAVISACASVNIDNPFIYKNNFSEWTSPRGNFGSTGVTDVQFRFDSTRKTILLLDSKNTDAIADSGFWIAPDERKSFISDGSGLNKYKDGNLVWRNTALANSVILHVGDLNEDGAEDLVIGRLNADRGPAELIIVSEQDGQSRWSHSFTGNQFGLGRQTFAIHKTASGNHLLVVGLIYSNTILVFEVESNLSKTRIKFSTAEIGSNSVLKNFLIGDCAGTPCLWVDSYGRLSAFSLIDGRRLQAQDYLNNDGRHTFGGVLKKLDDKILSISNSAYVNGWSLFGVAGVNGPTISRYQTQQLGSHGNKYKFMHDVVLYSDSQGVIYSALESTGLVTYFSTAKSDIKLIEGCGVADPVAYKRESDVLILLNCTDSARVYQLKSGLLTLYQRFEKVYFASTEYNRLNQTLPASDLNPAFILRDITGNGVYVSDLKSPLALLNPLKISGCNNLRSIQRITSKSYAVLCDGKGFVWSLAKISKVFDYNSYSYNIPLVSRVKNRDDFLVNYCNQGLCLYKWSRAGLQLHSVSVGNYLRPEGHHFNHFVFSGKHELIAGIVRTAAGAETVDVLRVTGIDGLVRWEVALNQTSGERNLNFVTQTDGKTWLAYRSSSETRIFNFHSGELVYSDNEVGQCNRVIAWADWSGNGAMHLVHHAGSSFRVVSPVNGLVFSRVMKAPYGSYMTAYAGKISLNNSGGMGLFNGKEMLLDDYVDTRLLESLPVVHDIKGEGDVYRINAAGLITVVRSSGLPTSFLDTKVDVTSFSGAYLNGDDIVDFLVGGRDGTLKAFDGATRKLIFSLDFTSQVVSAFVIKIRGEPVLVAAMSDGKIYHVPSGPLH